MQLFGTGVFEQQEETVSNLRGQAGRGQASSRLRAVAAVMLMLAAGNPAGFAQQVAGAEQRLRKRRLLSCLRPRRWR